MQNFDNICKNLNPTLLFVSRKTRYETGTSHYHDYIELTYVLKGKCNYEINGKLYEVKKGDILFINPNDTHTTIITDKTCPPELFAIGFTDISMSGLNMAENTFEFNEIPVVYSCPDNLRQSILPIIERILEEKTNKLPGRYFYMHASLVQLLLEIIRHFYKPACISNTYLLSDINEETLSVKGKKEIVSSICTYMEEHYERKLSLDDIASNMYLSPIYISKLFKEQTGDSPINYLISIRLKKAASLLKNSQLPIKEISSLVGYDNPYYFSKLFKKHFNITPKEFRDL